MDANREIEKQNEKEVWISGICVGGIGHLSTGSGDIGGKRVG